MSDLPKETPRTSTPPVAGAWGRLRAALGLRTVLLFVLVVVLPGGLLLLPFALASARKGTQRPQGVAERAHPASRDAAAYA